MNIKPLHDRIAIKPIAQEDKTAGGIIIPDTAKEKPMKGEIVAVGSGSRNDSGNIIPLELKIGDIVLFGKWGGTEVKINGHDLVIMKESDVLAIVK
jgi:chaperonin GroES